MVSIREDTSTEDLNVTRLQDPDNRIRVGKEDKAGRRDREPLPHHNTNNPPPTTGIVIHRRVRTN